MNFDGHEDQVVQMAVGLVNALTPGFELGRQLPALGERQLQRRAGAALTAPGDLLDGDRLAAPELGELLRLAARLPPIFAAAGDKDVDRAAEVVNHLLVEYRPVPYLARHDGQPWPFHFR